MKTTFKAVVAIAVPAIILAACSFDKKEKAKELKSEIAVTENPPHPSPPTHLDEVDKTYKQTSADGNSNNAISSSGSYTVTVQNQGAVTYTANGTAAGNTFSTQESQNSPAPSETKSIPVNLASAAAIENNKDSTHIFLRTADVKCKVNDVARATYKVEDIIRGLGGYVSYTDLTSAVESKNEVPVCADSLLQITHYNIENSMIIRVPNTNLDSALIAITPLVAHLDFRTLRANDIALQLLENKLHQARVSKYEARMSSDIDQHTKKLADATDAENALLDKQEQADNAKINNLSLTDQVKYSTINLTLYQPPVTESSLVYNDKALKPYEPPFATQLLEALQLGWNFLMLFILFLIKLWPLFGFAVVGIIIYRKWKTSEANSTTSVS